MTFSRANWMKILNSLPTGLQGDRVYYIVEDYLFQNKPMGCLNEDQLAIVRGVALMLGIEEGT